MKSKNLIIGLTICLGFSYLFLSCKDNDFENGDIVLRVGGKTEINIGQTAYNSKHKLLVRVENIEDSRCPEGAICIWEGNASVKISLTTEKNKYDFTLDTHNGPAFKNDTIIEMKKYQLIDVLPYPTLDEKSPKKTAIIFVERLK